MSVGFIMYEIVDKDSLKYQSINTPYSATVAQDLLDILLNIKVLTPSAYGKENNGWLDIHLKIKALTPRKSEYDEFQPFITKN